MFVHWRIPCCLHIKRPEQDKLILDKINLQTQALTSIEEDMNNLKGTRGAPINM